MSFLKKNWILFLILILGASLRLFGVTYDLPLSSSVGDEIRLVSGSLKILSEKSLIIDFVHGSYFPLLYYLYVPGLLIYALFLFLFSDINSLIGIKDSVILSLGSWLIVGRLISVALGIASIYLIYLIAQKLFDNKNVSLITALFFALSPLNVALSHFSKVWTPQLFFIFLFLFFFIKFFINSDNRITYKRLLIIAILILLSFATNLVGALSYVLFLLILLIFYFQLQIKYFFRFLFSKKSLFFHFLLSVGIFLTLFLSKSSLITYGLGFQRFIISDSEMATSWFGTIWDVNLLHRIGLSLSFLWQFETVVFLLFVPSFWLIYKNYRKSFYFLLFSFLVFFISLGPPLLHLTRPRYIFLSFPFLFIPVAYLINIYFQKITRKNILLGLLFIFISISPVLFINLKYDYLLYKNSTRLELYNWIENNLQPDENILLVDAYFLQDIIPNKEVIKLIKENSPQYYSTRLSYLENDLFNRLNPRKYGVYSSGFICEWPVEVIKNIKFDYLAISETHGSLNSLNICGDISMRHFSKKSLILEDDTAPFYNYSMGSGALMESYRPIYLIDKLGNKISIYRVEMD